jgi:hypothetical protein
MDKQGRLKEVALEYNLGHLKAIAIALVVWGLRKAYPRINRTTLTHLTIYQESVGNVPALSPRGNDMPKGTGTYGTNVGRPPKKKPVKK